MTHQAPRFALLTLEQCDFINAGARLSAVLDEMKLSDTQAATTTGLSDRQIGLWRTRPPQQLESLIKLCCALELDPIWFITGVSIRSLMASQDKTIITQSEIDVMAKVLETLRSQV